MKKIVTALAILTAIQLHGQLKNVDSYSIDGHTIAVGDSIQLGPGSGMEGSYVYVMTKPKTLNPMPVRLGPGYKGAAFMIDEILVLEEPVGGLDGASIVFKMRKQKIIASIRDAIESGEVILLQSPE